MFLAFLLKELFLKDISKVNNSYLPKTTLGWLNLIKLLQRNRLYFSKSPEKLIKTIPNLNINLVLETINLLNQQAETNNGNYQKIKKQLKQIINKTGIPLILLKNTNSLDNYKYYRSLKSFKFDIDILGKQSDLSIFRTHIKKLGFTTNIKEYGRPDKVISQYKFPRYLCNRLVYPYIEFRYKAITIPAETKKTILSPKNITAFTDELWKNTNPRTNDFNHLTNEYFLICHSLIYYFEDGCKGLNNLYRIWLFSHQNKNTLDWKKIYSIVKRYQVTNVFNFVLSLGEREFQGKISRGNININLCLRLIDLNFISKIYYLTKEHQNFWNRFDYFLIFLTKGILAEEPIYHKIIFFLNPKRILILSLSLINSYFVPSLWLRLPSKKSINNNNR